MAETNSWQCESRDEHGRFSGGGCIDTPENRQDLAELLEAEAGGQPEAFRVAVGQTILNRMRRNHVTTVRDVSRAHAHPRTPLPISSRIAADVLSGKAVDWTRGATHFYSPQSMPKEGQSTGGHDVGGGLESVSGVHDDGRPIRNYKPLWANSFVPVHVPGVAQSWGKFYRASGNGPVR